METKFVMYGAGAGYKGVAVSLFVGQILVDDSSTFWCYDFLTMMDGSVAIASTLSTDPITVPAASRSQMLALQSRDVRIEINGGAFLLPQRNDVSLEYWDPSAKKWIQLISDRVKVWGYGTGSKVDGKVSVKHKTTKRLYDMPVLG